MLMFILIKGNVYFILFYFIYSPLLVGVGVVNIVMIVYFS